MENKNVNNVNINIKKNISNINARKINDKIRLSLVQNLRLTKKKNKNMGGIAMVAEMNSVE